MHANQLLRTLRRSVVCVALLGLVLSAPASAGSAGPKQVIASINALAGAGSQVVFEGIMNTKNASPGMLGTEATWLQKFGSQTLKLIATPTSKPKGFCDSDIAWYTMSIALGPKGIVACLTVGGGISTTDVGVWVALPNGKTTSPTGAEYSGGAEDDTPGIRPGLVPALFGDGQFLGYLEIAPGPVLELFQIGADGKAKLVTDLAGLSSCGDKSTGCGNAAVDSGHIVIRQSGSSDLHVFTTAGKPVSTFSTDADPDTGAVAIRKDRIVALTADGRLEVYTLKGKLVHSYPVETWQLSRVSIYYGYAAYDSTRTQVSVLKLATGEAHRLVRVKASNRAVAHYGSSFGLQQSGLAVGRVGTTGFVYVPWKKIRAKFR